MESRAFFVEENHKYILLSGDYPQNESVFSVEKISTLDKLPEESAEILDYTPSVTGIIKSVNQDGEFIVDDFSGVPVEIVERAGNIGTAVHAAIEWGAELDRNTLPEEVNRHYKAYEKFMNEHEVVFQLMELALIRTGKKPFAGTIDAIGNVDGKKVIIDWKTGRNVTFANKIQQAAYKHLLSEYEEKYKDYEKWIVKLNKDSTYEIIVVSEDYDLIWADVLEKYYNPAAYLDVKSIKKEAGARISEELAERYVKVYEELENKKQELELLRHEILVEAGGQKAVGGRLTVSMTKNSTEIDEGILSNFAPEIHKKASKKVYTGRIDIIALSDILKPEVFSRLVKIEKEDSVFDNELAEKLVKENVKNIPDGLYRIAKRGSWRFNIAKEK